MMSDQGFLYREVCPHFGLGETSLRHWVEQVQFERSGGGP